MYHIYMQAVLHVVLSTQKFQGYDVDSDVKSKQVPVPPVNSTTSTKPVDWISTTGKDVLVFLSCPRLVRVFVRLRPLLSISPEDASKVPLTARILTFILKKDLQTKLIPSPHFVVASLACSKIRPSLVQRVSRLQR